MMISSFLTLNGARTTQMETRRQQRWHCKFIGRLSAALKALPRDLHPNSELQGTAVISTGTAVISTGNNSFLFVGQPSSTNQGGQH